MGTKNEKICFCKNCGGSYGNCALPLLHGRARGLHQDPQHKCARLRPVYRPRCYLELQKENGIKVNVDECDTPEELYNKAVNGDQSYDLICTSDYIIERFIKENRLSELNFDNIPNIKNIGEVYLEKSKSFDPENKYSVPHFWGTVGVIYNTKMVSEEDAKSWKDVLQREVFRKDNHVQQHPRLLPCRA